MFRKKDARLSVMVCESWVGRAILMMGVVWLRWISRVFASCCIPAWLAASPMPCMRTMGRWVGGCVVVAVVAVVAVVVVLVVAVVVVWL